MSTITLYKYRAINDWALGTLRSGQMWFSLPARLNDTFEFSMPVFISLSPTQLVEHFENRFKLAYVAPTFLDAMMKHGGSDSFPATGAFLESFLRSNKEGRCLYVIALIHYLRDRGLTTEAIVKELKLDTDSELRERLEGELRETYHQNQAIGSQCGVLSLSARRDDPLMWAHYADSCRGMCIGVTMDIGDLVNTDLLPLWVEYAEELPLLDPSHFFDRSPANVMEMLKIFYATKHVAWKHEAELRLVSKNGDLALDLPGKITEVVLGEKVRSADAQSVLEVLQGRKGIKFLKMMREPGTWKYQAYGSNIE